MVGCVGGGSNFGGIALPFVGEKLAGAEIEIIACEPAACPTLTRGLFAYDFGDTAQLTPLVTMHTLGHDFVPPGSTPAACATTGWRRSCRSSCWTG